MASVSYHTYSGLRQGNDSDSLVIDSPFALIKDNKVLYQYV